MRCSLSARSSTSSGCGPTTSSPSGQGRADAVLDRLGGYAAAPRIFVTSTTVAHRAATRASASTRTWVCGAPEPRATVRPSMDASATTGQAWLEPRGVIVPRSYPVTACAVIGSGSASRFVPRWARSPTCAASASSRRSQTFRGRWPPTGVTRCAPARHAFVMDAVGAVPASLARVDVVSHQSPQPPPRTPTGQRCGLRPASARTPTREDEAFDRARPSGLAVASMVSGPPRTGGITRLARVPAPGPSEIP